MPIQTGDVKLLKSAVMADVPEGGGAPTANVIADGVSNAIFPDISELDRAGGRVNVRKTVVSVQTDDTDLYFGANVILADPPEDPRVSVTLFSTGQTFDTRSQAASRVESYLNAGPELTGFLFENHIAGQRSIQLFMRTTDAPPAIGRTLLLRQNEGQPTQFEQYVRVTRATPEVRTFTTVVNGSLTDYQAQVVTCDLSDALRYDFKGCPASRLFRPTTDGNTTSTTHAKLRDTVVADAATYYGAVALTEAADIGDVYARVASVYTQVVPSAQSENPLVDQYHSAAFANVLATSPRLVTVGGSPMSQRIRIGQENRGYNYTTILKPLPAKGSVRIVYRALGNTYVVTDDGAGNLGGSGSGTVSYLTGSVSLTVQAMPDDRSAIVFYWGPNQAYTNRSGQAGFRAPEYAFQLEKTGIVPGSVTVTYTSGNVVKTITDNSAGKFTGDGSGEIAYTSGAVLLRPSAMPDASSQFSISYQWATTVEEAHPGLTPDAAGVVSFTLAQEPVPGSVTVEWVSARQTSTTSGASSASGSSTKSANSGQNIMLVSESSTYYSWQQEVAQAYRMPQEQRDVVLWDSQPMPPGFLSPAQYATVTIKKPVKVNTQTSASSSASFSQYSKQTASNQVSVYNSVTDDGAGKLYGTLGTVAYLARQVVVKVVGDYSESTYESGYERASAWESLNSTQEPTQTVAGTEVLTTTSGGGGSATAKGGEYGSSAFKEVFAASSLLVRYRVGSAGPQSHTETYTPPFVTIDLCPYTKDVIVPGSVRFTWMGTVYEDFEGLLYRGRTATDPGTVSGSVQYTDGTVLMTDYVVNGSPTAFSLDSLWTRKAVEPVSSVVFNTELSPIKPGGLVLSCVDAEGTQLLGTAAVDGSISGPHIRGQIDYASGLCEIQFGDYVLDSGLTPEQKSEWWYDAGDVRVADGKIWRPWPVMPETLRYNAVAYTYLPLDAGILGLDPVRLPSDGRVPIFRPGGFAVVGHTGTIVAPVSNGQTINCARVRLSRVRVIGADGVVIHTGYSADLEAGTVTFDNVAGYQQPVAIEHRIEDMVLVSDVQISGRLKFTRPLTHAYPVGSYVSSALVAGDLFARTSLVFDQATWNGTFSDTPGAAATATFNAAAYPIAVTNRGALTERWAVRFTSSTAFEVIGENVGVIAVGNTGTDCAPLNPNTGVPYFRIPALGWGSGWATGNVLRFNTIGAMFPVWVVRTVQQGPETVPDDSFTLLIRGDVNTP